MNQEQAIRILAEHNKWRRGEPPYDTVANPSPVTPKEIGEAIDYAIKYLIKKGTRA